PPQALGQGPSPQEQAMQQQLQGAQAHVALLSERLAVAEMRLKGKDEMRDIDAYEAQTKRMGTLLNFDKTDSPYAPVGSLEALIREIVRDAWAQGGMARVGNMAMADAMQQNALAAGMQGQQPPFAPQAPGGGAPAIPGLDNGQLAALSPVRPPFNPNV